MLILSLDTTAVTATACLCDGEKRLGEYTVTTTLHHSETMLPMIEHLLSSCGKSALDVELFTAAAGPGSFTGVRIGAAVLLGLAFGRNVPCVGVSSLESLSYNMKGFMGDFIVCPVMDARRNQLYNAIFRHTDGKITRLCDDRVIMSDELARELENYDIPVYFVGDGKHIIKNDFEKGLFPPEQIALQSAYSSAQVARLIYENTEDKTVFSDRTFKPTYLRSSQAERNLKKID